MNVLDRHIVTTPDGRALEAQTGGPEEAPAVLFHTGTPSAGRLFAGMVEAGASRGLRHVAYSRPGYAGSTRAEGRTVADCVADVAVIADALGLTRFYTAGWSGGGPHALATAALLGERVIAAATIAGVAPHDAEGLDWLDGMGEDNIEEFGAAREGAGALESFLAAHAEELREVDAGGVVAALGDLVSPVDVDALSGPFAEYLAASMRGAVSTGIWGWYDDDMAFVRDWGFDLTAITCPVTAWQGHEDRMVPPGHGEWLAAHIPGARRAIHPEHGHLSLVASRDGYGAIPDDLLAAAR